MRAKTACLPAGDRERWAHPNRLGSTIVISDRTGAVVDAHTYSPFGQSGEGDGGFPFRFTGQKLDPETGLYYYKARYYDPELGRFLQTDPIGYADQMNLYAYVGNDPINATDPSGEIQVRSSNVQIRKTYSASGNLERVEFSARATVGTRTGVTEFRARNYVRSASRQLTGMRELNGVEYVSNIDLMLGDENMLGNREGDIMLQRCNLCGEDVGGAP